MEDSMERLWEKVVAAIQREQEAMRDQSDEYTEAFSDGRVDAWSSILAEIRKEEQGVDYGSDI